MGGERRYRGGGERGWGVKGEECIRTRHGRGDPALGLSGSQSVLLNVHPHPALEIALNFFSPKFMFKMKVFFQGIHRIHVGVRGCHGAISSVL